MSSNPPGAQADIPRGTILLSDVSKCYQLYNRPQDRLKQALSLHRKRYYREFWALRGVNFQVPAGSAWGVIGRNGAGKSTLLQLIAGTVTPTAGTIRTRGRTAAMLELGAGFNPEYTGRENVFLCAAIMGMSAADIEGRYDDIAAFADIGDFLNQPVKSYSTGMYARLAFAVAVCANPDILLVDEMLSVGDAQFQHRCILRIRSLRASGVTLLLASHSMDTVKSACEMAVLLEKGQMIACGPSDGVADRYLNLTRDALNDQTQKLVDALSGSVAPRQKPLGKLRYGSGHVQLEQIRLLDESGKESTAFKFGQALTLEVAYRSSVDIDCLNVSFLVRDRTGVDLFGTTTFDEKTTLPAIRAGQAGKVRFGFVNPLRTGSYGISAAVTRVTRRDLSDNVLLDQVDEAAAFNSIGLIDRPVHYKVHVPVRVDAGADEKV